MKITVLIVYNAFYVLTIYVSNNISLLKNKLIIFSLILNGKKYIFFNKLDMNIVNCLYWYILMF